MNPSTSQQVLRLYKNLLRYGNQLQLTDKWYFMNRVRDEFEANKGLTSTEQIEFSIKRGEAVLKNKRIV
ncbi:uncharacterized protein LOC119076170 [Bradysia coprophila]|uniref:uncharacterized protein LOC119076170 n=1 Tax=Bradysia coprophila TaxID=38358 RepID=UPI00187D7A32|nr:uncharacterized protein LOC119076170 [Bradysia coprophila]